MHEQLIELTCRTCFWQESGRCYDERLMRAGGVNRIPRKVHGDDVNGMERTANLLAACTKTAKFVAPAKQEG